MNAGNKRKARSDMPENPERNDELRVPSWRLREEAGKRRAAEARIAELEQRLAEAESIIKSQREEWVFRRQSSVA
jgi:hypothetical protein